MFIRNHEGEISLDSEVGNELGFTSDKFVLGYLWKIKEDIYISLIMSQGRGRGNLSSLFNRIKELGYRIKVPSPLPEMREILKKKKFRKNYEKHNMCDEMVEVWSK